MKRILIADASKASLVMTSEVFKDHFPGVQVAVARNSNDAIEAVKTNGDLDAIVIDFDLPDRNGAETASRIKKICSTPLLITAFDRPDVKDSIESELAAYDDCLSWLKKPVNAELVVSIVKRFCEGRYRTQRRVDCLLPVLLELSTKGKEIVAKDAKSKALPSKLWIPVVVEDCSVGGLKLLLRKKDLEKLGLGKVSFSSSSVKVGDLLNIQLPTFDDIQSGRAASKNWLKTANANVDKGQPAKIKPLRTLDANSAVGSALKGKVIWSRLTDKGDLSFGILSENNVLSKRLFDATLLYVQKVQELGLNVEQVEDSAEDERVNTKQAKQSSSSPKKAPKSTSPSAAKENTKTNSKVKTKSKDELKDKKTSKKSTVSAKPKENPKAKSSKSVKTKKAQPKSSKPSSKTTAKASHTHTLKKAKKR